MPYSDLHSARILDPKDFDKFAFVKDKFGPGIHVNFGIKDGKAVVQSIRFDAKKFTPAEVKKWTEKNKFKIIKFLPVKEDMTASTTTGGIATHAKYMGIVKRNSKKKKNGVTENIEKMLEK